MDDEKSNRLRSYQRALPISLLRARASTMRRFKVVVDSYGLTLQQWRVVRALFDESPLDSKTLSERCVILPPSLTRIFRTLTSKGLVHTIKTDDARKHSVILSEEGRALFNEASRESELIYQELETAFGSDNMAELLRLLDLLRETADGLPELDLDQIKREAAR